MAVQAVPAAHGDYVHDVAYDYYGKRLSTCSADRRIKPIFSTRIPHGTSACPTISPGAEVQVWGQSADGNWHCQAEWEAHHGPVWRIDWAHPEFGQVMASCGWDHNVNVWEEAEAVDDKGRIVSRWNRRGQLVDARDSVNDVKFAPRTMGLVLAAGSSDGLVRIYEATDTMNLAHWDLKESIEADPTPGGVTALSWNSSPYDPEMLVVGGASRTVRIWGFVKSAKRWVPMLEFAGHADMCHDVAWAPNIGRSYHLIASASKDGHVCVWRVETDSALASAWSSSSSSSSGAKGSWSVKKLPDGTIDGSHVAAFADHHAPVWRVQWNITGTVVASTGEDGTLRLWRQSLAGRWENAAVIDNATVESAQGAARDSAAPPALAASMHTRAA